MTWMMTHPWMTFFLALALIEAAEHVVANICKTIMFLKQKKSGDGTEDGGSN